MLKPRLVIVPCFKYDNNTLHQKCQETSGMKIKEVVTMREYK